MSMRLPLVATALLIAPLAACGSGGTGDPAEPSATAPAAAADLPRPSAEASVTDAPKPSVPTQADDSTCGADKLGRWLNVLPSADMKAQIAAAVGERPIRYYTQGDPITMDFSPARLNVELGADGRIKLFRCG
jgi:hypothetical protein